ncbi:MarR family winged helix-turn-helix transcriptional regulator [Photobacterium sanguinicancri]|uniref:MarR family transcriptional regulator n=1 Tax=Photobacterium sanguinicancri TaxID=875932 RepID=A0AAW7Y2H0_9GAMM|nr:MarR family transcriptional regulator [Photobacterium sanguinicancri]KXI21673.1 MarR family transcriptional regulator [Photobacterium sanguinicancri]MDO6541931.1 MarR family transcriptional regulator [Photobacterium sanguinicancri]OZS43387.1 MarR family transcriptional regulator [Photobacterium sanguinicancri]
MKDIEQLNHTIIEFYEKLSSWEQSVVRGKGFSLPQVHIVEILGAHGAMRMKELADKIGVTTGTLTVQVDKMVNAGLICRRPHESDRRSILVELTTSGESLYQEHDQLHLNLTQDITAKLSDTDRLHLLKCLQVMNQEF